MPSSWNDWNTEPTRPRRRRASSSSLSASTRRPSSQTSPALGRSRLASRPDLSEEDRQRLEQNLADAKENLQAILDHFSGKDAVPEDGAVDAEKDAHGERAAEASSDGGG